MSGKYKQWLLAVGCALSLAVSAKQVVIDVRTPAEFAQGHVSGAINIDYAVIAQEIGKAGVAKGDKVILYCRSGRRSGIAQDALRALGFTQVENYGSLEQARRLLGQ